MTSNGHCNLTNMYLIARHLKVVMGNVIATEDVMVWVLILMTPIEIAPFPIFS